jgi:hypothetical protein
MKIVEKNRRPFGAIDRRNRESKAASDYCVPACRVTGTI